LIILTPSTIATMEFTELPETAQVRNPDSVVRAGFSAMEHSLMEQGARNPKEGVSTNKTKSR